MMKLQKVVIYLLFVFLIVATASASRLVEGSQVRESNTEVYLSDGQAVFTDLKTGFYVSEVINIDGIPFVPSEKYNDGDSVVWTTGEKGFLGLADPAVKIQYSHTGKSLKETITLGEDKALSFSLSLAGDSKLIPWERKTWKIVSSTSQDTMKGIVLEKPYGVDASGNKIEMSYKYDGETLSLIYDRKIKIVNTTLTKERNLKSAGTGLLIPQYDLVPISYPLVIDPTWTAVGDRWEFYDGLYTVVKWNTSGTTTWEVPADSLLVEYLVVAGGGGGGGTNPVSAGGGGGGGFLCGTALSVSGTETIVVGGGGAGGAAGGSRGTSGGASSLTNDGATISATGGGGGGGNPLYNGIDGGSGGGAYYSGTHGHGVGGEGNDGGTAVIVADYGAGGGGGKSAVGANGAAATGGNGGAGLSSIITGETVWYSGGGGGGIWKVADTPGSGGSSIGGAGNDNGDGYDAVASTGSGGGGGGGETTPHAGGDGSSGVVIVRYLEPYTFVDPLGFMIGNGADATIYFRNFRSVKDGSGINVSISGMYEIA